MSKEELIKKYREVVLKTNGGNDDYVVALCQIANAINELEDTTDLQNQLAELKAENERLKSNITVIHQNIRNSAKEDYQDIKSLEDDIETYKQQLKEKDEEIVYLTHDIDQLSKSYEILKNRLQTNTKQVCEKIRNKFSKDDIPDETTYYLHEFLDQLEGGVK